MLCGCGLGKVLRNDIEKPERDMQDEIAIQQTINRYSDGCSRREWDQVMATFTADGIWEIQTFNIKHQGHAAIRAVMEAFVGEMAYFVQMNSPAIIEIDGDRATARSTIRECGKYAGRDEALEVLGFYFDELVRTAEGWKFKHRTFRSAGLQTFPLKPASAPG
jgi:ketosteroid isomerase-like protein